MSAISIAFGLKTGIVLHLCSMTSFFFFQAEDGIRDTSVTGVQTCALPISVGLLLVWVTAEPLLTRWGIRFGRPPITLPLTASAVVENPVYKKILVPLDHTALDGQAIAHAASDRKSVV